MSVPLKKPVPTVVPPADKKRLIDRLARVEGQLRGIQKMIREDVECEKIAQQIGAARGALSKAFADQMTCAVARTLAGYGCDTEEVRDDVRDVLDLLAKYG